jgi:hypothetical protein
MPSSRNLDYRTAQLAVAAALVALLGAGLHAIGRSARADETCGGLELAPVERAAELPDLPMILNGWPLHALAGRGPPTITDDTACPGEELRFESSGITGGSLRIYRDAAHGSFIVTTDEDPPAVVGGIRRIPHTRPREGMTPRRALELATFSAALVLAVLAAVRLRTAWLFFGRRGLHRYRDGRLVEGGWITAGGREVAYTGLEAIAPGSVVFGHDAPALRDLGRLGEVRGSSGALQGYRGEAGHRVRVIPGDLSTKRLVALQFARSASSFALSAVAIAVLGLAAGHVALPFGAAPTDAELPLDARPR